MKNVWKIFGILLLSAFLFTAFSCSRNDDPVDNDFFIGTYNGAISYNASGTSIQKDNGKVVVTKIGSTTKYNFTFSDSIPDLNGIEFEKTGDHTMISVGSTATSYIRIDNNTLKIWYTKDGKTWTANCTR